MTDETLRYQWDGHTGVERAKALIGDLDTWINNLDNLPDFVDGQVIWVPLTEQQKQLIKAQKHTLEGIKEIIQDRFDIQ